MPSTVLPKVISVWRHDDGACNRRLDRTRFDVVAKGLERDNIRFSPDLR